MKFRTELVLPEATWQINYQHKICAIGSCFADVIGQKLQNYSWEIASNPFGTIFNPLSIHKLLRPQQNDWQNFILTHNETFFHYDYHSQIRHEQKDGLIQLIETTQAYTQDFLQKTDVLLLTWGTAFVYQLAENQMVVANCHKQNVKLFQKRLLLVEEITQDFILFYTYFRQINPKARIILTISPVRHLKDSLELNNVSKATLLLAKHLIINQFEEIGYFPSYELLLDDLRDYRFYASDLLHPSLEAIEYIWQKLVESCMDNATQNYVKDFDKIAKSLEHKSFNTQTEAYQKFHKKLQQQQLQFNQRYQKEVFEVGAN